MFVLKKFFLEITSYHSNHTVVLEYCEFDHIRTSTSVLSFFICFHVLISILLFQLEELLSVFPVRQFLW